MDLLGHLRRLLVYDGWANREALEALKRAEVPPPRAQRALAHIIGAERLWLGRLRQEAGAGAVWPELTIEECEAQLADLAQLWRSYAEELTPARLEQSIDYTNSKGEPWTSTVQDVLMHVVMHSAYHRGQVASELRGAGFTPAYTDFIHSVRQGLLE